MGIDAGLGRANVAIRATLDQLDRDLSDARGTVDNAVGRMVRGAGQAFQGLGQVALGGIGVATTAVAGLTGALASIAVDAAPVENISDAFEGLAESADTGADQMLAALERGSSGMIAQRDLMMSFNQAAQLVSTDFAVQLPDAMQYLSRVSASTGRDMGFLLDSLVTGVGRLSPMILDNLSVQSSLAQATERASEMFGLEADALDQAQVQAGMMSVVLDQLEANTASMPDVTDTAAARLARMEATFQNVKDTVGMAVLPVLNIFLGMVGDLAGRVLPPAVSFIENRLAPVLEALANYFSFVLMEGDPLNDFLGNIPESLRPIVQWLGELIAAIGEGIGVVQSGYGPFAGLMEILDNFLPDAVIEKLWQLYDIVSPIIDRVTAWVSENVRLEDILLVLGAAIASVVLPALWSVVSAVAPVIAIFVAAVGAIALLRAAWENDFLGIRTALTDAWQNAILPALQQLWQWLQVNVPVAIQTLSDFWTGTLQPALEAVWGWVQGTVIPLIADLWQWLQTKVPAAIQVLSDFWTGTLWPAIQSVIAFFQTNVMPVLSLVANVAVSVLGAAIATLSAFWQNILLPVIETVWNFFQNSIVPLFNAVADVASAVLGKAVEALAGLWQNVLQPALEVVWGVIEDKVLPTFQKIADFVKQTIGPVLEELGNAILPPIEGAFKGIGDAISGVVDWLKDLAGRIGNLELPDWLTPGSPTPFEIGLRGIGDAMRRLSQVQVPRLSSELRQVYEVEAVSRPDEAAVGRGGGQVVIYGLTLEGVQDRQGLLAELQALA